MTVPLLAVGPPGLAAYVLVFGAAAVACFAAIPRARDVEDDDTAAGLVALLATSGLWAASHVGFIAAPTPTLSVVFYYVGLVVGFATVGPWLYFCSAYTGRTLHRSRPLRRLAVAVFAVVVAVKLTNPIHGLYFRTAFVTTPFPHLAVENLALHWVAMGLAYALATVGYFMLLELFWQVDHESWPLVALVGVTGLPLVLDVLGRETAFLLDITYEPLGVAAFSVGVMFVFFADFRTVQLTSGREEPVVVFDDDDRVREFNRAAGELFPGLATGERLDEALPEVASQVDADEAVVEVAGPGGPRYYQVSTNAFSTDASRLGRVVMLTDITEREEYRTELERQNERLEQFASMVSHDLRNPLNVAQGQIGVAREEHDDEALEIAAESLERMEALIEDLLTLARQGQPIDETRPVSLETVSDRAWEVVATGEATLAVEEDVTVDADPDRLQQLLENLFRNAVEHGSRQTPDAVEHGSTSPQQATDAAEHGGSDVALTVGALADEPGFYVADDGPGIPPEDRDTVFDSGYTTNEDGTGFGLAIVAEIADAHGWDVSVTESDAGGARFELRTAGQSS